MKPAPWLIVAGIVLAWVASPAAIAGAQARPSAALAHSLGSGAPVDARARAALALGSMPGAEPSLARSLRADPSATVRAACATALGRLRTPPALAALRQSVVRDSSTIVRNAARAALAPPAPASRGCVDLGIVLVDGHDYGYRVCGDRLERFARPWSH